MWFNNGSRKSPHLILKRLYEPNRASEGHSISINPM